ncbi:MAG: 6-phosphofructokinase [Oscillospiraceae bacterium]|nr:6-phosphofructokinase [Oscillospiraceae bacterium]MDD5919870.1 6-phosphofructokinase [Oscillospiraceae bacterium]HAG56536.1 6-phosphofructokinase [Oscillospiraceae bacterium]HAO68547.1 6-phosphofructokinase [Oscillospiraceae bacterium]
MNQVKTIGVLTSGGDAPGMNAAIRAVVRAGIGKGMRVLGIRRGYNGLINGDMVEMNLRSVSDILQKGGTVLYTARCLEFKEEAGVEKARQTCVEAGLDGVVVIGGDGSFRGARDLSLRGIPCVGIPGTIDNDIASSDYTIGYDTAMNTVVQNVDRLRDTSQSHDRCSVVEVMGRGAGHIAVNTGLACGAIAILIPEIPFDVDRDIVAKIKASQKTGKQHFIVMVAEGVGHSHELAKEIEEKTGVESRATVLGHIQRGGSPTLRDRVVASEMGYYAVELLEKGIGNRVVVTKDGKVTDYDILEALSMKKSVDMNLLKIAQDIAL